MSQTIADLLGENLAADPFGEDLAGQLTAGYIPGRHVDFVPPVTLGDPVIGPENDQQLQIYRDERPIATDELGMQGPFVIPHPVRRAAGRRFPLNDEFGAGLDVGMPGLLPSQDTRHPTVFGPGQSVSLHAGVMPPEVLPDTYTVYYTGSPDVGYEEPQR